MMDSAATRQRLRQLANLFRSRDDEIFFRDTQARFSGRFYFEKPFAAFDSWNRLVFTGRIAGRILKMVVQVAGGPEATPWSCCLFRMGTHFLAHRCRSIG
jgi:hypothetical protein